MRWVERGVGEGVMVIHGWGDGGGTALTLMNVSRLSKRTGKVRRVFAAPGGIRGHVLKAK